MPKQVADDIVATVPVLAAVALDVLSLAESLRFLHRNPFTLFTILYSKATIRLFSGKYEIESILQACSSRKEHD